MYSMVLLYYNRTRYACEIHTHTHTHAKVCKETQTVQINKDWGKGVVIGENTL